MTPFGTRLREAMDARGPLCVGIDPHASLLADWGLSDDIAGLERFTRITVEALADRVALLKPQSAFFERFGSRGVAVLEKAVEEARAAGALVLMDAKRGDIGSTMAAYAATYLDPASPLFSDAVTVSPYLGFGSLRPALDLAATSGSGVFVLALTSNPEGAEVQRSTTADGRPLAQLMLDHMKAENAGASPWARSAPWSAPRWATPVWTSTSTARCSPPASAPRARPRPTCPASSAPPSATWSPASAAASCATARTPAPCARRRPATPTRSARRSPQDDRARPPGCDMRRIRGRTPRTCRNARRTVRGTAEPARRGCREVRAHGTLTNSLRKTRVFCLKSPDQLRLTRTFRLFSLTGAALAASLRREQTSTCASAWVAAHLVWSDQVPRRSVSDSSTSEVT